MHRIYMLVVKDRYLTSKEMHNGSHDDRLWKKIKQGRQMWQEKAGNEDLLFWDGDQERPF